MKPRIYRTVHGWVAVTGSEVYIYQSWTAAIDRVSRYYRSLG